MTLQTELDSKRFQLNLVLSIDGIFYGKYQVDADSTDIVGTGSKIDTNKIGIVDTVRINPIKVDLRNVRTTVQTLSFDLLDEDELISNTIGSSSSSLLDVDVILYVGVITGSFDLSDYLIISKTRIKSINRRENKYAFSGTEVVDKMNADMFTTQDTLNGAISDGVTSLILNDASSFPSSGKVKIDDEVILYGGKTSNTLTSLSRGDLSSTAAAHDDEADVFFMFGSGDINPITFLLQLITSPGGGGTYDVLSDGLGIDQTLVDVSTFETIRDDNFSGEEFNFFLSDVGNGLAFLEENILLATNTRFFSKDGQISLALLDQIDLSSSVSDIDENSTDSRVPQWKISTNRLTNKVIIKYDFSEGLNKFTRTFVSTDSDSISTYGQKPALTLEFRAVRASLSGSTIATNRASRLLSRLSTPKADIDVTTQLDKSTFDIAQKVLFTHRYVPSSGAGLGFSEQLEILSKAVDFNTQKVRFKLAFTSYTGARIGLIAPTNLITSITSQKIFDISDASSYKVGYFLVLWDETNGVYFADAANEIDSISTNTITMKDSFSTTLTTSVRIKFADYNDASVEQRGRYAYIVQNSGFFDDSTQGYQIII